LQVLIKYFYFQVKKTLDERYYSKCSWCIDRNL